MSESESADILIEDALKVGRSGAWYSLVLPAFRSKMVGSARRSKSVTLLALLYSIVTAADFIYFLVVRPCPHASFLLSMSLESFPIRCPAILLAVLSLPARFRIILLHPDLELLSS